MKAAEPKIPSSRIHPARPAEPFFQPEREGGLAEVQEEQTPALHRKPAFEREGEEPDSRDPVQRKPAFFSEEVPVQPKIDTAAPRTGVVVAPPAFFATSGDGGFFAPAPRPFFTPAPVQAKLTIGLSDGRYEREADDVADQVVRLPDKTVAPPPPVQQQEDDEDDERVRAKPLFETITPLVQRQEDEEAVQANGADCEREEGQRVEGPQQSEGEAIVQARALLQRRADGDAGAAGSDLESRLHSTKGGGRSLDEPARSRMEAGIGADFSGVRIHTDRDAVRMNNELGAQAFTHGNDVYFNENKYNPGTTDGEHLLAHELTHTVQQGAAVRKQPLSPTGGARIQRGVIADLINKVLRNVPGYTLLTVIIGKNPVTGEDVPRTAANLIDGLLGLLPGGGLLADKLKETGALQEAGAWLSSEIDRLGITFSYIKSLVSQAWDELSIWNSFSTNLGIVQRIFGEPYRRVKAFVGGIAGKIKEFIFRGALKLVGAPVDKVMGILNKGADVIQRILDDPIGFFRNLARAVGGGIKRFVGNIKQHLLSGLIDWLTGALSEVPITLPQTFDLKGILHLVLQILGLTWDRIRAKLVKRLGEKVVAAAEKGVEIIRRLVTEGPIALWEMLKEKAAEIKQQVMEGIRNWVITQIVKQAVIKLLSFLNPAGALLQAVLGLYNLVMFLIENVTRIVDFVNSVFTSIGEIARGAIGKASEFIEKAMGRTVPILLNFLARLIGLSGIGKTVSNIIEKIRKPIDKVVNKALDFMVKGIKKLVKKGKKGFEKVKGKVLQWWKSRKKFKTKNGASHSLYFRGTGKKAKLVAASREAELRGQVTSVKIANDDPKKTEKTTAKQEALRLIGEIEQLAQRTDPNTGAKTPDFDNLLNALAPHIITLADAPQGDVPESSAPVYGGPSSVGFGTTMDIFILTRKGPVGTDTSGAPDLPTYTILSKRKESEAGSRTFYRKGHLLSESLHGPGDTWRNLTPLSESGNSLHETQVENELKRRVGQTQTTEPQSEFLFPQMRPTPTPGGAIFKYSVRAVYGTRSDKGSLKGQVDSSSKSDQEKVTIKEIIDAEDKVPLHLVISVEQIDKDGKPVQGGFRLSNKQIQNDLKRRVDEYHLEGGSGSGTQNPTLF